MEQETTTAASAAALRANLVDDGAADEIVRCLVALAEAPAEAKADPVAFILEHFGAGTQPPLTKRNPPVATTLLTSYDVLEENTRLKSRVAALRAEVKEKRAQLKAHLPEGTLTVFNISASGVPDTDAVGGHSDPFVRVSLLDVPHLDDDDDDADYDKLDPIAFAEFCNQHGIAAQTSAIQNCANPSWEGEVLEVKLPSGTSRPPRVLVRMWDDDVTKSDDPLASLAVQLEPLGGSFEGLMLKGRGDLPDIPVNFEYKMVEVDPETKKLAGAV